MILSNDQVIEMGLEPCGFYTRRSSLPLRYQLSHSPRFSRPGGATQLHAISLRSTIFTDEFVKQRIHISAGE